MKTELLSLRGKESRRRSVGRGNDEPTGRMNLCRVQWCARKADAPLLRSPVPPLIVDHTGPRRKNEPGAAVGRMRIQCCREDCFVGQIPEMEKVCVEMASYCRKRKKVECGLPSRHHRMSLASFDRSPATQSINQFTDGGILGRAHWARQGGRRWHISLWSLSFYSQKM